MGTSESKENIVTSEDLLSFIGKRVKFRFIPKIVGEPAYNNFGNAKISTGTKEYSPHFDIQPDEGEYAIYGNSSILYPVTMEMIKKGKSSLLIKDFETEGIVEVLEIEVLQNPLRYKTEICFEDGEVFRFISDEKPCKHNKNAEIRNSFTINYVTADD